MTLDEARETLGVARGASAKEVRDAFRRRARDLHPDRHPMASDAERRRLSLAFDRARQARDILVTFAGAPSASSPSNERRPSTSSSARSSTTSAPPRRDRARPRTSDSHRRTEAPRVTVRFDEFVRAADAAGFGPGSRTRRWIDWPRAIAWSTVGVAVLAIAGAGYVATTVA
ncbi:DnaJ domain-containing protein [Microbacterium sp. 179-I 1D1 NHS]|uniref:DnaJ domain-containing protein n=1 Tax=Microbacterium sp. 179-I 1D1 NHS TaxID=3374298 RepID=UPI003879E51E